jgi:chromosomal replication initiator protein
MSSTTVTSDQLWQSFLDSAARQISSHVLETWLRPVRCVGYADGRLLLEVRDRFARDWLNDHYLDFIRDGLCHLLGEPPAVEWVINPAVSPAPEERASEPLADEASEKPSVADDRRRQLNARYVFSTFVSGPSNQFAVAACKAVADNPAASYNPLFLFGGVGLGKTHLLSAIGHQVLTDRPQMRVIYTSSEQFVNEVVNAVRFSRLDEFHAKYRRNCDVILMDDIQLIAGKERTQHEFFHIFNTLYDSQRQIVVTSDKLPHEIPDIEERLRNRFQ